MFFAQRPQQPASFRPNVAMSAERVTEPARPAACTSLSVSPLQRQTYIGGPLSGMGLRVLLIDYENRYQLIRVYSGSGGLSSGGFQGASAGWERAMVRCGATSRDGSAGLILALAVFAEEARFQGRTFCSL